MISLRPPGALLWIRGLVFTVLVPGVLGGLVPSLIQSGSGLAGGLWPAGWLAVALGAALYGSSLLRFVSSGGTPAIFFTRPLRFLIGEEPHTLVRGGLYRFTRNPMYVGVVLAVLGQAIVRASLPIAVYGAGLWLAFHLVLVFQEEPHLRRERGPAYDDYCRRVPRWFGWSK
jgi:protein-S-isoprenylcysteine O-methyltransferase Ste14